MSARETPAWLTVMDHTGDAGIQVRAERVENLYARAAWAMFSLISDPDAVELARENLVHAKAPDREALLVRWLSELLFLHETEHLVFGRFDVCEVADTELQAVVWGEPVDPERHVLGMEIKAVTYHGLQVAREGDGWRAQVIFDL